MIPPFRCRFAVGPRFQLAADWAGRLSAGAGVTEAGGRFFPRGPWRPLAADEIMLLTCGPQDQAATGRLFQIPGHLRAAWWELLDRAAEARQATLPGFPVFADHVAEFLRFKHLEAPTILHMEVVVTAPGSCSMRSDPDTGAPAGLGPSLPSWAASAGGEGLVLPRLWGLVNLGDEDARLVLIAVPITGLASPTDPRPPGPPPATVGDLVRQFLREFPDVPPIRVRLGPGEGFQLPPAGLILDADATDKTEPDVFLLISERPLPPPGVPPGDARFANP